MFHLVSPSSAKEKDAHADLQKPLFMASQKRFLDSKKRFWEATFCSF